MIVTFDVDKLPGCALTQMETPSQNLLINSSELVAIFEELRVVKSELNSLITLIKDEKRKEKMFGLWVSEPEVLMATGLCRTSLYNLYKAGKVTKSTLSGKANYYKMSDFKKLLDENELK